MELYYANICGLVRKTYLFLSYFSFLMSLDKHSSKIFCRIREGSEIGLFHLLICCCVNVEWGHVCALVCLYRPEITFTKIFDLFPQ